MFGDVLDTTESGTKKTENKKTQKNQTTPTSKKGVNANTQRTFDEIERNCKKINDEFEQFIRDMSEDVL